MRKHSPAILEDHSDGEIQRSVREPRSEGRHSPVLKELPSER